ncbi:GON-4-like protein isoform X2 [Neocloeon triangulifer]|uniref:GON-4-like protein isoform X2 n=1 Tax=Neocloeon triangulifer TaxID=2078957 RepID=UPI00286F5D03|nr:GON-4-like protein isoform X2 [Neocloeon triangulifer]
MADGKEKKSTSSPLLCTPKKAMGSSRNVKRPASAEARINHRGDSDAFTDSSDDELTIDESPGPSSKPRRPRRIKTKEATRQFVSQGLEEFEDEIEQQLGSKAKKSKLTIGNVKNILKHVITNQHVLAMVKKSMREEGDGAGSTDDEFPYEPKLTRAKTKELLLTQTPIPWPVTPAKATPGSATKKLIDQVHDDSSDDEEYQPNEDEAENSEDECNSSLASDIEPALTPQPTTPRSIADCSTQTTWTEDGLFKMPNTNFELMETVGMRTRSKVSLTDTPLETIEQSFIPPDITTDMYETECDNEDWKQFLNEFTKPLNAVHDILDDDEADPEYNILDDEEAEDKEELRADRAVKVTKKELNELISELMESMEPSDDETEADTTLPFNSNTTAESSEVLNTNVHTLVQFLVPGTPPSLKTSANPPTAAQEQENLPPANENALPCIEEHGLVEDVSEELPIFTLGQRLLLGQQMMQHVQLLAQNYMQCTINPKMALQAQEMKENLMSLKYLGGTNPASGFYAQNLDLILKTVTDWDKLWESSTIKQNFKEFFLNEEERCEMLKKKKLVYVPHLNVNFLKIISNSNAFVYPTLLPHCGFHPQPIQRHQTFLLSEDCLIAMGLAQFTAYLEELDDEKKMPSMANVSNLIAELMMPVKSAPAIKQRMKFAKQFYPENPITLYFAMKEAPALIHRVFTPKFIPLAQQPPSLLPITWKAFIHNDFA